VPKWRNGRRGGLKHRWGQPRPGSNPGFGTTIGTALHAAVAVTDDVLRQGHRLDWLGRCELLDVALRAIVTGYDRPEVREN
jgi:hypothetical protein